MQSIVWSEAFWIRNHGLVGRILHTLPWVYVALVPPNNNNLGIFCFLLNVGLLLQITRWSTADKLCTAWLLSHINAIKPGLICTTPPPHTPLNPYHIRKHQTQRIHYTNARGTDVTASRRSWLCTWLHCTWEHTNRSCVCGRCARKSWDQPQCTTAGITYMSNQSFAWACRSARKRNYMSICVHTQINTCTHTWTVTVHVMCLTKNVNSSCVHDRIYTHVYIFIYIYIYTCMYKHTCTYDYIYIYTYTNACVLTCVSIEIVLLVFWLTSRDSSHVWQRTPDIRCAELQWSTDHPN